MTAQQRIIEIFISLLEQQNVSTKIIANQYQISQRSAQRDINLIKDTLTLMHADSRIIKNTTTNQYSLSQVAKLDSKDFFIKKILLSSRSLYKEEIYQTVGELVALASDDDREKLMESIRNGITFMPLIKDDCCRIDKV